MKKILLACLLVSTSVFAHEPDPRPTPVVQTLPVVLVRHKDNRGLAVVTGLLGLAVGVEVGISWDKGHSKVEASPEVSR